MPLARAWEVWFARPLKLELWMGLPSLLHARVADVCPPKRIEPDPAEEEFYAAYRDQSSLTYRAFTTPSGFHNFSAMNSPEARSMAIPSFGAIGSARSLAKFYAAMANGGELDGLRVLNQATIECIENGACQRRDRVLQTETVFSHGFMRDPVADNGRKLRAKFGPCERAFGHPGAGGVNGFADPGRGLGIAYVMNQMKSGVLPNEKSEALIEACHQEG
jgi:CubicO group peptidase (beta-lactamase class C family)